MPKSLIIILSFYYCFSLPVLGQGTQWGLQFNQIASDKGLSELTNHFVFKDSKGFVWISSVEGLNRFDGKRVKTYKSNPTDTTSLLDDNIQSTFFEDNNSDIWFTTVNGIHCYRRKRDNFDRFTIKKEDNVSNNIGYIALFLEQNRWLWTQVEGKLYKFDTKAPPQYKSEYLHDLDAVRFAIDTFRNGQVRKIVACYWSAKEGVDIINYNKQAQIITQQAFFTKNQINYPALTIRQGLIENDTLVWLTTGQSLVRLNFQKNVKFTIHLPFPLSSTVSNIAQSNNGNLWVSSDQEPLLIFNKQNKHFENQNIHYSEASRNIYKSAQLFTDKTNNLWVSTFKRGVFYTSLKTQLFFNPIGRINRYPYSIEQIIEDKNQNIWLLYSTATSGYIQLKKNGTLIKQEQSIPPHSKFLQAQNGQLWFSKLKKSVDLYDFKKSQFLTQINDTLLEIMDIKDLNDSTLLIGSTKGLMYFDTKSNILFKDSVHGSSWNFQKYGSCFWLDNPNGNIYCYQIDENRLGKNIKKYNSFDVINYFHASKYTPSVLWVATAKGLVKINTKTFTDTLLTEKDGLPSNYIQAVLEDKKGNLWCSTNQGIFKYNLNTKQSKLYTKRHGLSSDAYNRGAALLSSTGEMWFGGNNGVDVFHPDSIRDIGHAPQSAIVGLKIFDKYWKGETAIEVAEHITLKHNENTLTLELAAMEYTDPENNRYKVALVAEGDTIQWVDLGTQNYVTYPNLREGKYTFMLLTANTEGIWNEAPKTLVIEIKPPYWRTWWFLTLVALATMALVGYIVYLRLSKVIALQKIRLNLYENLHDDIGARLTAIVLIVDELRGKGLSKEPKLEKAGTISRNIVANMRRLVWATAPENDALETVVQQMQTDRKLLLPSGTKFVLTMDKTLATKPIGGDKRYQMLSVFNEALTNIAKYAEATSVETQIDITDDQLTMTIRDNGKGFDPDAPRENTIMSSGHGVRNMQRRANRIKGDLNITSKIGEGTSVQFSFSMKEDSFWTKLSSIFSKTHQNR